jgi:hypothetical protein
MISLNGRRLKGTKSHISDISRLLIWEHYLKTAAYNISHVDADEIITFPSHAMSGLAPCFRTGCLTQKAGDRFWHLQREVLAQYRAQCGCDLNPSNWTSFG